LASCRLYDGLLFLWRLPPSIRVFLAALAIVDDLGAVLVIGLFYTTELNTTALWQAGAITVALGGLNYLGVRRNWLYVAVGILLWAAILKSGIHTTVAGVLLALFIPAT